MPFRFDERMDQALRSLKIFLMWRRNTWEAVANGDHGMLTCPYDFKLATLLTDMHVQLSAKAQYQAVATFELGNQPSSDQNPP